VTLETENDVGSEEKGVVRDNSRYRSLCDWEDMVPFIEVRDWVEWLMAMTAKQWMALDKLS
jgi:hypothetical protein